MMATTAKPAAPEGVRPQRRAGLPPLAKVGGLVVLLGVLVVLGVLSTALGAKDLTVWQVWSALWRDDGSYATGVIRDLRVPRTVIGLVVGVALGLAGALMQALTRNPLADPGLLGVNAGASAAVVFAIAVFGVQSFTGYVWFAFLGAAVAAVAVYVLGAAGRGATPVRLALAGAAVSAAVSGVIGGLTAMDSATYDYMRFWTVGSLAGRTFDLIGQLVPFVAVGVVVALLLTRSLNAVALGEDVATALGTRVGLTRLFGAVAVVLLCGAATAAAGPIGFVGLVVPLAARAIVGPDQRWLMPYSMLLAPILLLSADIVGRLVLPTGELEVGAVTALIGAPLFIMMVRRRRIAAL